jgi:hypothetical protein
MSEQFTTMFRDEHRQVRDALLELGDAFTARDAAAARSLLGHIAELTGPHFRYEEETMYPLLVQIFGAEYIDSLIDDHDVAIAGSRRLVELVEGSYEPAEIEEAHRVIRKILPHVSDCDGLSIMVEKLRDDEVDAIFAKRDETLAAGLDLLTWDSTVRTRPVLAA